MKALIAEILYLSCGAKVAPSIVEAVTVNVIYYRRRFFIGCQLPCNPVARWAVILENPFFVLLFLWFLTFLPLPPLAPYAGGSGFLAFIAALLLGLYLFLPALRG